MPENKEGHDLDREVLELLNELRVALPGVQVLFAFLLVVPFNQGWTKVESSGKAAYFTAFIATTIASVLLMAPTSQHRLRWRQRDKEQLLTTANRLTIAGMVALAIALTSAVFFVTNELFGGGTGVGVAAGAAVLFGLFWFGVPLWREARDERS